MYLFTDFNVYSRTLLNGWTFFVHFKILSFLGVRCSKKCIFDLVSFFGSSDQKRLFRIIKSQVVYFVRKFFKGIKIKFYLCLLVKDGVDDSIYGWGSWILYVIQTIITELLVPCVVRVTWHNDSIQERKVSRKTL